MKKTITMTVNGDTVTLEVDDRQTLAEVIREDLHLLGTHLICEKGECGACTVILNGRAVNSCLMLAADADGKEIETIEGLSQGFQLHPIQERFVEKGAVQCGMCTSGMIMTAAAFLRQNPQPDETAVRHAIAGNFCRCTGYVRIVDAILSSASTSEET